MKKPKNFESLKLYESLIKFEQEILVPFGKRFTNEVCITFKNRKSVLPLVNYRVMLRTELNKFFLKSVFSKEVYDRVFKAFDKQNFNISRGFVTGEEVLWIIHDAMTTNSVYYVFGVSEVSCCNLYDPFFPK